MMTQIASHQREEPSTQTSINIVAQAAVSVCSYAALQKVFYNKNPTSIGGWYMHILNFLSPTT